MFLTQWFKTKESKSNNNNKGCRDVFLELCRLFSTAFEAHNIRIQLMSLLLALVGKSWLVVERIKISKRSHGVNKLDLIMSFDC